MNKKPEYKKIFPLFGLRRILENPCGEISSDGTPLPKFPEGGLYCLERKPQKRKAREILQDMRRGNVFSH